MNLIASRSFSLVGRGGVKFPKSFLKKVRSHLEPLAGELGNTLVLLGVLASMFVVTKAANFVEREDGNLWPTLVRWIFNLQLALTLMVRVVVNSRLLWREISKPWRLTSDEIQSPVTEVTDRPGNPLPHADGSATMGSVHALRGR